MIILNLLVVELLNGDEEGIRCSSSSAIIYDWLYYLGKEIFYLAAFKSIVVLTLFGGIINSIEFMETDV